MIQSLKTISHISFTDCLLSPLANNFMRVLELFGMT